MPTMEDVLKELKDNNYTDEKFSKWLINPNIRKIYSLDQLEEVKKLWFSNIKKSTTPVEKETIKKNKKD